MLTLNVAALLKEPPGATRDVIVDESAPAFGPDLRTTTPVQGTARLFRTQDGIVVRADLATTVEVECSRCLDPVAATVEAHIAEEYRPTINISTGAPLPPPEDDALRIDERHILDLTETARQYFLTALPLSVLCRADCRGLCSRCGANLNEGPCGCDDEALANPFATLVEILPINQSETRAG